jgi:hypothetical protein
VLVEVEAENIPKEYHNDFFYENKITGNPAILIEIKNITVLKMYRNYRKFH